MRMATNDTDFLDRSLVKAPSIVAREIAGELLLVPLRRTAADVQTIYTTNEVGCYIWGLIDGHRTPREILEAIVEEFDVGREQAQGDLVVFLQQAEQAGAIKVM